MDPDEVGAVDQRGRPGFPPRFAAMGTHFAWIVKLDDPADFVLVLARIEEKGGTIEGQIGPYEGIYSPVQAILFGRLG